LDELLDFELRITETARVTAEARPGRHDDLVNGLGLAVLVDTSMGGVQYLPLSVLGWDMAAPSFTCAGSRGHGAGPPGGLAFRAGAPVESGEAPPLPLDLGKSRRTEQGVLSYLLYEEGGSRNGFGQKPEFRDVSSRGAIRSSRADAPVRVRSQKVGRDGRPFPDFQHPPVVEVALAVGFEPLPGLSGAKLGVLWQEHYRAKGMSSVEEQPPIKMPVEQFGVMVPPTLRVEMVAALPPSRLWFSTPDGTQLVQAQNDWFARNWRKMETGEEYPRYPAVRAAFDEDFALFSQFVESEGLGEILPNQCEVTYVNHIFAGEGWEGHGSESQVLSFLRKTPKAAFLADTESARVQLTYPIPGDDGPQGRLQITAEPAFRRKDKKPILVLTLTARGRSSKEGLEGVSEFLDTGHEWVVFGFLEATTGRMHEHWGLEHGER
jgi:uncharacterized protein (TIGR04255 family)